MSLIKTLLLLLLSAVLTLCGLLLPVHFRTIDPDALQAAGALGDSNARKISQSLDAAHIGPARMLAEATGLSGQFKETIQALIQSRPNLSLTGGPDPSLEAFIQLLPQTRLRSEQTTPVISLLLPLNERLTQVEQLATSSNANVAALLGIRNLKGMTQLHPASHAAGAPYDAGLLTLAQLIESGEIDTDWGGQIGALANQAGAGNVQAIAAIENLVMATLSLGRQLDFRSLANLARSSLSIGNWSAMATLFRAMPDKIPTLYSILHYEKGVQAAFDYLNKYSESGIQDLELALRSGPAAVRYLLSENLPVHQPTELSRRIIEPFKKYRPPDITQLSVADRTTSLWLKLGCFLLSGLAFSLAMAAAWRGSSAQAREIGYFTPAILARDACLSLAFALTVWFTFEPDILQSTNNEVESGPRLEFVVAGALESLQSPVKTMQTLNQVTLLVLLLFFVIQLVIYCFCLIKLKEISKKTLNPHMKLQLLDNEENLFDFGLYVGLGGTVLSLIMVALGIVEASLMAAYASTLFGILFVALLKVIHLRPYRRQLILERGMMGESGPDQASLMNNIKL